MNRPVMFRVMFGLVLLLVCTGALLAQERAAAPGCECSPGHWWDANRKSCVTGACKVPNMPDGDKGGGYFAWQGTLFVNTPCVSKCAGNLNLTTTTGQAGWKLVSGPGSGYPITPVVVPAYPGWSTIPGASWISSDANSGSERGAGDYTYEYTFCLCADAKGPNLALTFLADNGAKVLLNNQQLFVTTGNKNFVPPPKTVNYNGTAGWNIPGTNTVRIIVQNESSVTGLAASLTVRADNGACNVK